MLQCKVKVGSSSSYSSTIDEHKCCFDAVVADIEDKLLNKNTVYHLTQLCDPVRKKLRDMNVKDAHLYSSRHLIKHLESHFEGNIAVVPQVGTSS